LGGIKAEQHATASSVQAALSGAATRLVGTSTGHRIELFSEMALSDHGPMTRNPEIWREEPHGMRVTRYDHCNLHGPNIDQVVEFFTQVLDFSLTEAAETPDGIAAFLSCSNKAHDVAFIRRPEPAKFHHVAFSLDSWHEVGQARGHHCPL
jgi:catechol 2,3-dioxygenase